ncbi:hypothetical protein SeLEV6574_g04951 [Synchytrium endobioticum]|nr:hypothetical protein SeLEV6574_g04951 [Synchytrium endobioticum]
MPAMKHSQEDNTKPMLAYYVSGHGFGHATRVIPIVAELIKRNEFGTIIIITSAPPFLFDTLVSTGHAVLRRVNIDVGVIQTDAVSVDRQKTVRALNEFISNGSYDELILNEVQWLQTMQIGMVLMDAPFLPAVAAKQCNIPSTMITNFCFDNIYSSLCTSPTTLESHLLKTIYAAYEQTTYLIKLPGETPLPSFANHVPHTIHRVPLVVRRNAKSSTQVRKELGIPLRSKVILICFGGHQLLEGADGWSFDEIFPDDSWYGLVVGLDMKDLHGERSQRLKALSQTAYLPDYINCSDVILGKIGYGICSEVVAHQKPLIYIKRSGWAEEEGLLNNLMVPYGSGAFEMSYTDFTNGKWTDCIEKAICHRNCKSPRQEITLDGAEKVVDLVGYLMAEHCSIEL